MAGSVEEGDFQIVVEDLIGPDVLGDAPRLAGGDLGLAKVVEQGGFPVIDVTHDRDDRRAVFQQIDRLRDGRFRLLDDDLDLVDALVLVALLALEDEAVDFTDLRGDFRLQRLVGSGEDADLDQVRHDVERLQPETGGQRGNQDRRLDDDQLGIVRRNFLSFHRRHDRCDRLGNDDFRRRIGRGLFLVEDLGNGADDRLAGAGGLADFGFLVIREEIERVGFLGVQDAWCRRYDFSLLALALAARRFLGRIE